MAEAHGGLEHPKSDLEQMTGHCFAVDDIVGYLSTYSAAVTKGCQWLIVARNLPRLYCPIGSILTPKLPARLLPSFNIQRCQSCAIIHRQSTSTDHMDIQSST